MSNSIQERAEATPTKSLTAYVHVMCDVSDSTRLTYTLRPEKDRLWVDVGAGAGEVTLFLDRVGLTRLTAALVKAAAELDEQVAGVKHTRAVS